MKNNNEMIQKHAYLIMAHNEPEILERLLRLLDDSRNDIYLHIDKKGNKLLENRLKECVNYSELNFISRMDVEWGGDSMIECELGLMKAAINGRYDYYHLLSGVDLPIKTQDEIHEFFVANNGKEFISLDFCEEMLDEFKERICYYYLLQNKIGRRKGKMVGVAYYVQVAMLNIQKFFGINRMKKWHVNFYKGENWFSISHRMLSYVIEHEKWIKKYCYRSICADEIFIQVLAYNSPYKNNIISNSLRLVDWKRGNPYVWRKKDFLEIISSQQLFARKFSWTIDKQIIEKLYENIKEKQKR